MLFRNRFLSALVWTSLCTVPCTMASDIVNSVANLTISLDTDAQLVSATATSTTFNLTGPESFISASANGHQRFDKFLQFRGDIRGNTIGDRLWIFNHVRFDVTWFYEVANASAGVGGFYPTLQFGGHSDPLVNPFGRNQFNSYPNPDGSTEIRFTDSGVGVSHVSPLWWQGTTETTEWNFFILRLPLYIITESPNGSGIAGIRSITVYADTYEVAVPTPSTASFALVAVAGCVRRKR